MGKKVMMLSVLLAVSLLAMPLVGCTKPVKLTIWEPKHKTVVTESTITVSGYVSDVKATVWVNGSRVEFTQKGKTTASFATTVTLSEGENIIEVIAAQGKAGKWKNIVTKKIPVTYTPSE